MGYEITAVSPRGLRIGSVRVGTNGSQEVMFALWFAAYGVGSLPDSDRVRRRWLVAYGPAADWMRANHPHRSPTVLDMQTMIGINSGTGDNVCGGYLRPRAEAIVRGLSHNPTRCPVLAPVVEFWNDSYGVRLPADLVARLAASAASLAPALAKSCWYTRMTEVANLLQMAREEGASCRAG